MQILDENHGFMGNREKPESWKKEANLDFKSQLYPYFHITCMYYWLLRAEGPLNRVLMLLFFYITTGCVIVCLEGVWWYYTLSTATIFNIIFKMIFCAAIMTMPMYYLVYIKLYHFHFSTQSIRYFACITPVFCFDSTSSIFKQSGHCYAETVETTVTPLWRHKEISRTMVESAKQIFCRVARRRPNDGHLRYLIAKS